MGMTARIALALTCMMFVAVGAFGQDRAPSAVDPKACAPGERMLPDTTAPHPPATTGRNTSENLSDKLARTDGVICPENVDPHIKAPTPETGKMPVIPPPGTPGGDPTVRPK